jgi:hypothetical protein
LLGHLDDGIDLDESDRLVAKDSPIGAISPDRPTKAIEPDSQPWTNCAGEPLMAITSPWSDALIRATPPKPG